VTSPNFGVLEAREDACDMPTPSIHNPMLPNYLKAFNYRYAWENLPV